MRVTVDTNVLSRAVVLDASERQCFRLGRLFPAAHRVTGAVTRSRFPQNVACGIAAPRSSVNDSQHGQLFELRIRKRKTWSQ